MSKTLLRKLSFLLILVMAMTMMYIVPVHAVPATYYVSYSDPNANDNNAGTDPNNPWKNLSKVSQQTFNAGDVILLKCGDTWSGQELVLKGNGSPSNWITLSSYGTGSKPVITNPSSDSDPALVSDLNQGTDPRSSVKVAIKIKDVAGWKIKGIKIGGTGDPNNNVEYGIVCFNTKQTQSDGIWIEDCELNDINGARQNEQADNPVPFLNKSTAIQIFGYWVPYTNVTIKNCDIINTKVGIYLTRVNGMNVDGVYFYDIGVSAAPFQGVEGGIMQNCTFRHIGYSGIWQGTVAFGFSYANYNNGGTIIVKDCEVDDVADPLTNDGIAIDFEGLNRNVTITDCYIRNCDSSGFLNYDNSNTYYNDNMVIQNNKFENCGRKDPNTIPVFNRFYRNQSGSITGNKIQRAISGQKINSVINNLVINYGFESGDPNWTFSNNNAEVVNEKTNVYYFEKSLKLSPVSSATQNVSASASKVYTVELWSKNSVSAESGQITVKFKNSSGGVLRTDVLSLPTGTSYQKSLFTLASSPTGTTSMDIIIEKNSGKYNLYVDNVMVYENLADEQALTDSYPTGYTTSSNTNYGPATPIPFTTPPSVSETNLARSGSVTITASSEQGTYYKSKAADGTAGVDGSYEWATTSSDPNRWIKFDWGSNSYTINRARLFDSRNTSNWTIGGKLTLHKTDGSEVAVNVPAGIKNNGDVRDVFFDSITNVNWVRFDITRSSGSNPGMSEIEIYQAGIPTPTPTPVPTLAPAPTPTPYQASAGFTDRMGIDQWFYQYLNASTYSNMTWDASNSWWSKSGTWALIGSNAQHPANTDDSVRTWVAPYSGYVNITGTSILQSTSGTDGVKVKINKVNDDDEAISTLWGSVTLTTPAPSSSHSVTNVRVDAGDRIYFEQNKNANEDNDVTTWDPNIAYVAQVPLTTGTYNNTDNKILYVGVWASATDASFYQNDFHSSATPGGFYEITFTGTRARLYSVKSDWMGKANIYLDYMFRETVDFYSPTNQTDCLMYDTNVKDLNMPSGNHTITVFIRGDKDPNSSAPIVISDKIVIN